MLPEKEYLELMHKVVAEVLPQELAAFELSGTHLAKELFDGNVPGCASGSADEFQFVDGILDVLKFVALMIGTFEGIWKLADRIKKLREKDIDEDALADEWKAYLLERGVSEKLAAEVVTRFGSDMITLARRSASKP